MEGTNYYCDNPSSSSSSSSSSFPPLLSFSEDCLIQILLWLPVISLLRFKSVCKSWRAIIQNPFFIHTHHATTTNKVVFLRYSDWIRRGEIFTVSGPEFEVYEDLGIPGPEFEEVLEDSYTPYYRNNKENFRYQDITMAGCCNGIICLHSKCYDPRMFLHPKKDNHPRNPKCCTISLWNPAIKQQYRFLPIPSALEDKNHDGENLNHFIDRGLDIPAHSVKHFVGFGFDVKTKDYKVLLITYDIYVERFYYYARGVQVYSFSSNSWKCIDASHAQPNLTICFDDDWGNGHYLNGSYLFMGGYLYEGATNSSLCSEEIILISQECCFNPVIMSFDFTKEIFKTIQLPFDFKLKTDEYRKSADIILFGEKIAVTNASIPCQPNMFYPTACLDIWVLNENDGSESWSKFYTFVSDARPKFIKDNGEFILLDATSVPKLQLLNVVTEEIKDLKYDCEGPWTPSDGVSSFITRVGVYKPSLLPIAGNGASNR